MEEGVTMEERKPMYEFDLGFMGKVICSAETAISIQAIVHMAKGQAQRDNINAFIQVCD